MVERCINEVVYIDIAELVKEEMFKVAIMANGVYSTFDLKTYPAPMDNVELQLHYMQLNDEEIASSSKYYSKVIYSNDADCFNILKCIEKVRKIKEDLVKDENAIWSTISVNEFGSGDERRFEIKYKRANVDDDKKSLEADNSKKHTESEIYDISRVTMRDGTTHNISDLVTYDKEYLYFPIEFGPVHSSSVVRIKIPLKTLKEALDQIE